MKVQARSRAGIAWVEFRLDGHRTTTVRQAPFTWVWRTKSVRAGGHTLSVTAVDTAGRRRTVSRRVRVAKQPKAAQPGAPGAGGLTPVTPVPPFPGLPRRSSPPLPPSTRFVSTSGSDAGTCAASSPCQTFDRAYHVASPGEVIEVAAGSYPKQILTADPSKAGMALTFIRSAPGASVSPSQLEFVDAENVEVRDMTTSGFYIRRGSNAITLRNIVSSGNGTFITSATNVSLIDTEISNVRLR